MRLLLGGQEYCYEILNIKRYNKRRIDTD